jgi:hypothetical protein
MSFFTNFFGAGTPDPNPSGMRDLMKNPAMREIVAELHDKLTHDERQELVRLIMLRDTVKVQEFLKSRIPGFEDKLKKASGGV